MKAPGYIFSTSNCVYTGMSIKRYELILEVWRKEGEREVSGFGLTGSEKTTPGVERTAK